MIRLMGSRATWRSSLRATAQVRLMPIAAARLPAARSSSSTWWMKTSSSDGTMRSIEVGGLPVLLERRGDLPPSLVGVSHDHVDAGAEDRRLQGPLLLAEQLEGLAEPGRGHLQDRAAGEHLLELADRALRGQASGVDQGQAVAVLGLVEVVGGHEDRDAAAGHLVDEGPEAPPREGVHSAGGLVEEHHLRLVEDRAGQGQPLLPAAGQLAGEPVLLAARGRPSRWPTPRAPGRGRRAGRRPRRRSGGSAAR